MFEDKKANSNQPGPYLGYGGGGGGQVLPDQQYPPGQYQTHHYPHYFPLFSSLAPQYCCNSVALDQMQPTSLPPSGHHHPMHLSARQLQEGGRQRRREERRELRSEGGSIREEQRASNKEQLMREGRKSRLVGEEGRGRVVDQSKHVGLDPEERVAMEQAGKWMEGDPPPVSAFHVPPKTVAGQQGLVKEVRGECEGGEERVSMEAEKMVVVGKEEDEEAVIEEELGGIVQDMQISSWTEGTHI